jgi:hypothetical protein
MYELLRRLTAAAGANAPPEASVASRLLCGTHQGRRETGLKRCFAQRPRPWLRSSTTPKAAHLRQPLLLKFGHCAAQKVITHPCLCTAPLRAAAPKERRLTNRDECTFDGAAVAYTRSAQP